MRAFLSCAFVCILLTGHGCVHNLDNSKLTITPGVGISNILELGMTIKEVDRATGDLTFNKLEAFSRFLSQNIWIVRVPSLGATWSQKSETARVEFIYFYVNSKMIREAPDISSLSRFRGKMSGGLSFEKDGGVTKADVIKVLGEPKHTILPSDPDDMISEWTKVGEPFVCQNDPDTEAIFYPGQGVCLTLHGNRVVAVEIYKKVSVEKHQREELGSHPNGTKLRRADQGEHRVR